MLLLAAVATVVPASAEQASQPGSPAAGQIDTGGRHTCALFDGNVRCWGSGNAGQLGLGNTRTIGDNEIPGAVGPVDVGAGRTATAISAGGAHTCAVLDNGNVSCWGFGAEGRLGYANTNTIGDDEVPASAGAVDLGAGRTAAAISAGSAHTCAVLDNGNVSCWGLGANGRLGYANTNTIGDDEAPASAGAVDLGAGRTATAITAGEGHTCALLDNGRVLCWGFPAEGRLGYGNENTIGDNETPASAGAVDLGAGRTATAISAGSDHTCAVLDNGDVRCWGFGFNGQLGYGNTSNIGDNETPGSAGPVDIGAGRTATAISAGAGHTCARLDTADVRCWGAGGLGQLGYANTRTIGDNETPGEFGPVDIGAGRTATAISAGEFFTCAQLDDANVRCWGVNGRGQLGYGNTDTIGDNETPGSVGPVNIGTPPPPTASINDARVIEGGIGEGSLTFTVTLSSASSDVVEVDFATADDSATAPADYESRSGRVTFPVDDTSETVTVKTKGDTIDEPDERFLVNLSSPINATDGKLQGVGTIVDDDAPAAGSRPAPTPAPKDDDSRRVRAALRRERLRARALRNCLSRAAAPSTRPTRRMAPRARRRAARVRAAARRRCLRRYGRTPGRVTGLTARARSRTKVVLSFLAPGSDRRRLPAARSYLVKQSTKPIRGRSGFRRATSLCRGSCSFKVTRVGVRVNLTVADLRPRTTYYYAIAARDNVSRRLGPRSRVVSVRTR